MTATLTPDQIKLLSPAQVNAMTVAQLSIFSPDQIALFSPAQVAAFSPVTLSGLANSFFATLPNSFIHALSTVQIAALTASQIGVLKLSQFSAFSQLQLTSLNAIQTGALSSDIIGGLTSKQLSEFNHVQLQYLLPSQVANISGSTLAGLPPGLIGVLPVSFVANLTAQQIVWLTQNELLQLNVTKLSPGTVRAILSKLTSKQVGLIGAVQLSALTADDISSLPSTIVQSFNAEQLLALSSAQVKALTQAQARAISSATLFDLGSNFGTFVAKLATPAYLTLAQFLLLTGEEIATLSAANINSLDPAILASFDENTISRLSNPQIQGLINSVLAQFSVRQIRAISLLQMTEFTTLQISTFSAAIVKNFSGAQLLSMSKTQVQKLSQLAVAAISSDQLRAMTTNIATFLAEVGSVMWITTDQLNALSLSQLNSLTVAAPGQPSIFSTMSASQKSVVNNLLVWANGLANLDEVVQYTLSKYSSDYAVQATFNDPVAMANSTQVFLSTGTFGTFRSHYLSAYGHDFSYDIYKWYIVNEFLHAFNADSPQGAADLDQSTLAKLVKFFGTATQSNPFYLSANAIAFHLPKQGDLSAPAQSVDILSYGNLMVPETLAYVETILNGRLAAVVASNGDIVEFFNTLSAQKSYNYIAGLTISVLKNLTPAQMQRLSISTVGSFTASQLLVLTVDQLAALSAKQVSAIQPAVIAQYQLGFANFSAAQLTDLAHLQAAVLNPPQLGVLSPAKLSVIVLSMSAYLSPNAITALPLTSISTIPEYALTGFSNAQIHAFSSVQLGALTPRQVWGLSSSQLGALGAKIFSLSTVAIEGLSKEQMAGVLAFTNGTPNGGKIPLVSMTVSQLKLVPVSDLTQIKGDVLSEVSNLSVLTVAQSRSLLTDQLVKLSAANISALGVKPVNYMNPTEIAALSIADIRALAPDVIADLAPIQFDAFSAAQIQALSTAQIQAILPEVVASFTNAEIRKFSLVQQQFLRSAASDATAWTQSQVDVTGAAPTTPQFIKLNSAVALKRNLYSAATNARGVMGVWEKNLWIPATNSSSKPIATSHLSDIAANKIEILRTYTDLKGNIAAARQSNQGMRLIGSIMALSAVGDDITQAIQDSDDKTKLGLDVVATIAHLASLLQVPIAVAEGMVNKYNSVYEEAIREGADAKSAASKAALAEGLATTGFDQLLAFYESVKTSVANGETSAQIAAELGAKASALIKLNVFMVETNLIGLHDTWVMNNTADVVHESRVHVLPETLSPLRINPKTISSNAIFLVADLASAANGIYGAVVNKKDPVQVAMNSISAAGSMALFIGDAFPLVFQTQSNAGAAVSTSEPIYSGMRYAARALAVGGILAEAATLGMQAYTLADAYKKNPTTGTLIGLIGGEISVAIQGAVFLVAMAIGGPIGLVAGAIIAAIMPNFSAIGQAVDLLNQRNLLDSEGRTVEGDTIVTALRTIAILNAIPTTQWYSMIYSNVIMSHLYSTMSADNNSLVFKAASQDYTWSMTGVTDGRNEVVSLKTFIAAQESAGNTLTTMRYLGAMTLKLADYFAVKTSNTATITGLSDLYITASKDYVPSANGGDAAGHSQVTASVSSASNYILADTGTGQEYVNFSRPDDVAGAVVIDATKSTQAMIFGVQSGGVTIRGGSNADTYMVSTKALAEGLSIIGGSSLNDTVEIEEDTAAPVSPVINLDQFTDVLTVKGAAPIEDPSTGVVTHNIVTGTQASQSYSYNEGVDSVTMTGGHGEVEIGGNGSFVQMKGGSNVVFPILGYIDNHLLAPGSYDGGATATSDDDNTINFAGSVSQLHISIADPSLASSVETIAASNDILAVSDQAMFKNFQVVRSSNLGDFIEISGAKSLKELMLGFGNNEVSVTDSSNLIIDSTVGADQIEISSSKDVTIYSEGNATIITKLVTGLAVSLHGIADTLESDFGTDGDVHVGVGSGTHTIFLSGQSSETEVEALYDDDMTVVHDTTARTRSSVIVLGSDIGHELIQWDSASHTITALSTDGSNQSIQYTLDSGRTDAASIVNALSYIDFMAPLAAGAVRTGSVSADLLVRAIQAPGAVAQTYTSSLLGITVSGYNMDTLTHTVASSHWA